MDLRVIPYFCTKETLIKYPVKPQTTEDTGKHRGTQTLDQKFP
jgi:hypothetical protein